MTSLAQRRTAGREGRESRAVGYCRRSTDRQEQSIADQQRAIEAHCAERSVELLRWHIDDAISGTRATNRPAFQAMMAEAQKRNCDFGLVVVYDVKRFGRLDNDEAGFYRHILRRHGVEVVYVSEGFGGDDSDDLLRPVKQWQARQESKDLSKVTIRGQLSRADHGWWMGGVPPYGYDLRYENDRGEFLLTLQFMPDGTKRQLDERGCVVRTLQRGERVNVSKRDRARLVPSEDQRVETIRTIFRLYTEERRGLSAVAGRLNAAKTPTPRGPAWSPMYAGEWRDSTVRAILVNPIYCGDMVWNRRTDARFHRIEGGRAVERREAYGARLVPNDPNDWIIARDAHPALIPRRTWELAQTMRSKRAQPLAECGEARSIGGWSGQRARFLLSGLVRCGRCGGRYQGVTRRKGKKRADGSVVKTRYYGCGGYIAKGRSACEFGPVKQEALEETVITAVLDFYRERYMGEGGMERLGAAVRAHLGDEAEDLVEARKRLEADRKRVESTIANLLDAMSGATRDLVEERLISLRDERESLRRRAAELERLALAEADVQDLIQDVGAFLAGLERTLREDAPDRRVAALRRCVESVTIEAADGAVRMEIRELPVEGQQSSDAGITCVIIPAI